MTKYDDFGRPIYETAEDYNKAHKGGVCPRTYDSPEGENYQHNTGDAINRYKSVAHRHATRQGSKNAKKIIMIIVVFIIAVNIGIVFAMFQMVGESFGEGFGSFEEEWIDEDVAETEKYLGDADVPLPEGFEKFKYNGYPCTLPATFEDIWDMKLRIVDYDVMNEVFYGGYEEMLDIYDDYSGSYIGTIRVSNPSSESLPMMECTVDYFYIYNLAVDNDAEMIPNFKFCDGLTFESSYEDVEAYLGTPYYYYAEEYEDGEYYEFYDWVYYGEDEIHCVSISFWNNEMSSISIEKKAYEEK